MERYEEKKALAEQLHGEWKLVEYNMVKHSYLWGSIYQTDEEHFDGDTNTITRFTNSFSLYDTTVILSKYLSETNLHISYNNELTIKSVITKKSYNISNHYNYATTTSAGNADWRDMVDLNLYLILDGSSQYRYGTLLNGNTLILRLYTGTNQSGYGDPHTEETYEYIFEKR